MLLYVLRWDIVPDKWDAYLAWVEAAIEKTLAVSGPTELRAFRPVAGESQVVVTYEFPDFDAWSTWFDHEQIQTVFSELFTLTSNVERELWEPSPIVPEPVHPEE